MKSYKYFVLIIAVLFLYSCESGFFVEEPENNSEAMFEELWNTFYTDYANFEERGVDWEQLYNTYRPMVDNNTSSEELYEIFKQLLRPLDDGHVSLIVPNEKVYISNLIIDQEIDNDLFDLELIKTKYLQSDYKENGYGGNTYGWVGDVGYVHMGWISDNMPDISKILDEFSSAKGLIVDLRHNQGGDFTWAFTYFGRFTDSERYVYRSKTKNGKGKDDYTDWFEWSISPSGDYFDKPIVLLTDRYTISAGERAVLGYKTLPNVTHMGDTTNGAFATKIGKELPNGWDYYVVTQKIEYKDGKSYEGPGMPPDIYVKNTSEEMQAGQDKTLEEALARF